MTPPSSRSSRLHYELIRSLVDSGSIPSHDALQAALRCSAPELDAAFEELARLHGVVLHPSSRHVWAIHPFSLAPTNDLVVHFPIPMTQAWDNVIYTCSTMLLFRDGHQVDEWSARHQIPRGDVQPVARVLELSKRWYGEHLSPNWTKKSVADARALFAELGFTHPVWHLPSQDVRF